jgi:hypothetical protein
MAPSDLTDLAITQSRASHGFTLREQAARGGSDVPAGDRRRPHLGRHFPSEGASLPPRISIQRPTQTDRGAGPISLPKLLVAGDSVGCVGRDIGGTGRCPLDVPAGESRLDARHEETLAQRR